MGEKMSRRRADRDGSKTTRPALDVLDRDIDRLLYEGDPRAGAEIVPITDGFSTYWQALIWYQAAAVRTLGNVSEIFPARNLMPESTIFKHLFLPEQEEHSELVRLRLVEELDQVKEDSYRRFREEANEHVTNGNEDASPLARANPQEERNPLMRPAFRRLDDHQVNALRQLWGGFADRKQMDRWVSSLSVPTNGEKPDQLLNRIIGSKALLRALLEQDSDSATLTRYRFAVAVLLPAFCAAARSLNGSESADQDKISHDGW